MRHINVLNSLSNFKATSKTEKKVREERNIFSQQIRDDWDNELSTVSIEKKSLINYLSNPKEYPHEYKPALDYYLHNYDEYDDILSAKFQEIIDFIESNKYSPNFEQYTQICKTLKIPVKDKIEPEVIDFLSQYIADNSPTVTTLETLERTIEIKNSLKDLPDYIQMDSNSQKDFFNNEFFKDQDRAYVLNIIKLLIDFKVSTVKNSKIEEYDNPLYKYNYLVKCLLFPQDHNLPPKQIKKLKSATIVRGYAKIPTIHTRIRVNKRSRMIVSFDETIQKIVLITTDDHKVLK